MNTKHDAETKHEPVHAPTRAQRIANTIAGVRAQSRLCGLLGLVLLAPLGMGARGCETASVGADCGQKGAPACACDYGGKGYLAGDSFASADGCNQCSCQKSGKVLCTSKACLTDAGTRDGGDQGGNGKTCGGLQGASCPKGEYCDFQPDAQCGAADQTGKCAAIPQVCNDLYAPVCGCDDKTYPNACNAAGAGVSVASSGACGGSGTSDGGTISGGCDYNGKHYAVGDGFPSSDGCNTCSCKGDNSVICTLRACAAPKTCGGLQGAQCDKGQYCDFAVDAQCGAADQTGTCMDIPQACTKEYLPVCGCDDTTYGNACTANAAGVSIASKGACASSSTDAGTGGGCDYHGKHYAEGDTFPDTDGCNNCSCTKGGQVACTLIACKPTGAACGGLLGKGCATGEYCDFPIATQCGSGDQEGTCTTIPQVCNDLYSPVCGCDGKTYANACNAAGAGTSVSTQGACK